MISGSKIKDIVSNPNILTLFRIASAPVIILLMLFPIPLLAFLAARLCSRDAAEDVLQTLFFTIVRKRRTLARARYLSRPKAVVIKTRTVTTISA